MRKFVIAVAMLTGMAACRSHRVEQTEVRTADSVAVHSVRHDTVRVATCYVLERPVIRIARTDSPAVQVEIRGRRLTASAAVESAATQMHDTVATRRAEVTAEAEVRTERAPSPLGPFAAGLAAGAVLMIILRRSWRGIRSRL